VTRIAAKLNHENIVVHHEYQHACVLDQAQLLPTTVQLICYSINKISIMQDGEVTVIGLEQKRALKSTVRDCNTKEKFMS
jgi:hypothetical protein